MSDSWNRFSGFLDSLRSAKAVQPLAFILEPEQVEPLLPAPLPHGSGMYIEVIVNELFLGERRKWFVEYQPMVFSAVGMQYGGTDSIVPFILGPAQMLKGLPPGKIPPSVLLLDTRVAGPTPFKSDRFAVQMVLSRHAVQNHARDLLDVVQSTSQALSFTTQLSSYITLAGPILTGIERLFRLDADALLVGLRQEFDAGEERVFQPFYGLLVDAPENAYAKSDFKVIGNRLMHGRGQNPFREASYVLFSVGVSRERPLSQVERMPFWSTWTTASKLALTATDDDDWKRAKANLLVFYQSMLESPDLIEKQADQIFAERRDRLVKLHSDALKVIAASKGASEPKGSPPNALAAATKVLDL